MKIKKLECDQFAGIDDADYSFNDRMNVIVGKNESGKSTLIELIYQTLFHTVNLKKNTDKDFINSFFPVKKDTGVQGDTIDGKIVFETDDGSYTLTKEWSQDKSNSSIKLKTPDGSTIKTYNTAEDIIDDQLKFGEGIYRSIIFASQKLQNSAIAELLGDKSGKNDTLKQEIRDTVQEAVEVTGGVSPDSIEAVLEEKEAEYNGRWDDESCEPEGGKHKRGISNPWSKGTGLIVNSWYSMEKSRSELENAEEGEKIEKLRKKDLDKAEKDYDAAKADYDELNKNKSLIENYENLQSLLNENNSKLKGLKNAAEDWPDVITKLEKGKKLAKEYEDSVTKKHYEEICAYKNKISELKKDLAEKGDVSAEDRKKADKADKELTSLKSKLSGMNLSASIHLEKDYSAEVHKISDGENVDISSGNFDITDAVQITVPGVVGISLTPKDVDVDDIKSRLKELTEELKGIFDKYKVKDIDALDQVYLECEDIRQELTQQQNALEIKMNGADFETIAVNVKDIPENIRTPEDIQTDITKLCAGKTVNSFVDLMSEKVNEYKKNYASVEELNKTIAEVTAERDKISGKIDAVGEIPEKFKKIADIDAELKKHDQRVTDLDDARKQCRDALTDIERTLGDRSVEELQDELTQKEEKFNSLRNEYHHILHIREVFNDLRAQKPDGQMKDIEDKFRKYLNKISNGSEDLKKLDDKLDDVKIVSGHNYLSYGILSEGTKDTISLAFRLAVLEHLFPDGDGLAIFDDPLTDMDEDRRKISCDLINDFAKNNQVIFVTCSKEYVSLLPGNVIQA